MNPGPYYSASSRRSTGRQRGTAPNVHRRRAGVATITVIVFIGLLAWALLPSLYPAVRQLGLPLADSTVIRQQAAAKHLDPALIAAVIYAETKFEPRTSSAGARGLMQILPSTAHFLAGLSGGVRFTTGDLATPAVNVAYGSYYLRYLLDHYRGNELAAIAAYNAGLSNVDEWLSGDHAQGLQLTIARIPFPQTRIYVQRVLDAQSAYRAAYPHQLGLD